CGCARRQTCRIESRGAADFCRLSRDQCDPDGDSRERPREVVRGVRLLRRSVAAAGRVYADVLAVLDAVCCAVLFRLQGRADAARHYSLIAPRSLDRTLASAHG